MPAAPAVKVAVISGGSSGIGLACARCLLARGYQVVLLARDMDRLQSARAELGPDFAAFVELIPTDVDDPASCQAAIEAVTHRYGRIDWLITSAGIVEPGMFLDLDLAAHRAQMETNYFGTLHLVQAVVPVMRPMGGKITLVSSGAAFLGIAGYSAYAPSKFAVRALAEILRLELEPEGIAVSVAFPPDTETPQLERERRHRPPVTRLVSEKAGVMTAKQVAEGIISRAETGAFVLTLSAPIAFLVRFHSLYGPLFAWQQRRLLKRLGQQQRASSG
jgi:3-dehydrosphinganine reductase